MQVVDNLASRLAMLRVAVPLLLIVLTKSLAPPLRIIAETERIVFIEKPCGVPFHRPDEGSTSPGLMDLVRDAQTAGLINHGGQLFPVHRLDAVTSGLLMMAKDSDAAGKISRALQRRKADTDLDLITKYYVALVDTKVPKQGRIAGDMAPSRRGAWKLLRTSNDPAVTRYAHRGSLPSTFPEGESGSSGTPPAKRLIILSPETGRTHQLRVALKSIGAPIIGDALYGGTTADRCYLHAAAIRLNLEQLGISGPDEPSSLFVSSIPDHGSFWASASDMSPVWSQAVEYIRSGDMK